MEEPQGQRDRRVEELWRRLDPAGLGELDLKGLQKGLRRIDHRMLSCLLAPMLVRGTEVGMVVGDPC